MFRRVVEHTEEGTPFRTRVLKRNVKSVRIGRISVLPSLLYSSSHWVSSQADVARAPPFLSVSRHAPSLSFSARYTHEGVDAGRQKPCLDRSPLCPSFSFPLSSTSEIPLSLASERARLRSVAAAAGYYTPPRAHNHHQPQTTTTTTQLYARTLEKSNITGSRPILVPIAPRIDRVGQSLSFSFSSAPARHQTNEDTRLCGSGPASRDETRHRCLLFQIASMITLFRAVFFLFSFLPSRSRRSRDTGSPSSPRP